MCSGVPSKAGSVHASQFSDLNLDPAQERLKFVNLTKNAFFDDDDANDDCKALNATTKKKLEKLLKEQEDDQFLRKTHMPKVCQGMPYKGPVVATHAGATRGNNFVCTNETHSRSTNNGFTRGEGGAFYAHWVSGWKHTLEQNESQTNTYNTMSTLRLTTLLPCWDRLLRDEEEKSVWRTEQRLEWNKTQYEC